MVVCRRKKAVNEDGSMSRPAGAISVRRIGAITYYAK
jgi:hypothetical protein